MTTEDRMAANKAVAEGFLRLAGKENRPREAFARYAAPGFVHHNPGFPRGPEALAAAMEADAKEHPNREIDVRNVVAEGDLVAVHSHVRQDTQDRDFACVHLFRIEDGRVAELWDVVQPVPARSPNADGMF
jgi:predicted SnoaL-like aldol condensation-catalyzing enzyme